MIPAARSEKVRERKYGLKLRHNDTEDKDFYKGAICHLLSGRDDKR